MGPERVYPASAGGQWGLAVTRWAFHRDHSGCGGPPKGRAGAWRRLALRNCHGVVWAHVSQLPYSSLWLPAHFLIASLMSRSFQF